MPSDKPIGGYFPKVSVSKAKIEYPLSSVGLFYTEGIQKPLPPRLSCPWWMIYRDLGYPIDFDELSWDDQNLWSEYLAVLMAYEEAERQRKHRDKVSNEQPPGTLRLTDSQIGRILNNEQHTRPVMFDRHLPAYTALCGDRIARPGDMITGGTVDDTKPTSIPDYASSEAQKIVYVAAAVNF